MTRLLQLAASYTMLLSMVPSGMGFSPPGTATTMMMTSPERVTMLSSTPHRLVYGLSHTPRRRHGFITPLRMSDVPFESSEEALSKESPMDTDPTVDWDGMVNTSIMAAVCAALIFKFVSVDFGMMHGWTFSEMAYRIPLDNWNDYTEILEAAPVATKAVTSASVYTLGDILSQRAQGKTNGELDRSRILRNLIAGLIAHGPLSHVWYNLSEGLFDDVLSWTEWWSFIPKVILDQTTWGPIWNNTYILLMGLMQGNSPKSLVGEMKRTTVPLIVSGLKLWPLAHCITYGLIPVENRLLWVDMVEIIWVTILSTQATSEAGNEGEVVGESE